MVVGPLLFAAYIIIKTSESGGGGGEYESQSAVFEPAIEDWVANELASPEEAPPLGLGNPLWPVLPGGKTINAFPFKTMVGLYSKDLYDAVLASAPSVILDEDNPTINDFPPGLYDSGGLANLIAGPWSLNRVEVFTRPHSKEELQAADMWPKES
jgi:hypothetical protein